MSDGLISPVDPLLNTWIIAWNVHQLQINPLNLFHANIFFPLSNTLAFSEHLIVPSLIAMPAVIISKNPIFGYNLLQLLSFVLSGFAAYLLVFHLTKNRKAALIGGIIFAFHPFRFRQIGHIQNIMVFWMPLCLLYLHKLRKNPRTKYVVLFALFFILQALSCGYLGVFLSLIVAVAFLYYFLFIPKNKILSVIKKVTVAAVLAMIIIGLFLYPYLKVKEEHRFERSEKNNIMFSANILGYAIISRFNENVFYHTFSRNLRRIMMRTDEEKIRPIGRGLFPGIVTIFLVLFAFFIPALSKDSHVLRNSSGIKKYFLRVEKVVHTLLFIDFLLIIAVVVTRKAGLTLPVSLLLLLLTIKVCLGRFTLRNKIGDEKYALIDRNYYLFMGVLTLILSLGPRFFLITHNFGKGPYALLYKYLFFFKGIRVPERFGIMTMLAVSVLAGYGVVRVSKLLKRRGQIILFFIVSGLLVYEYICIPLPSVHISREPAEVYKWLAEDQGDYGILEYPLETQQQNKYYMYWSTFHWKKLVNGSSGFNPPIISRMRVLTRDKKTFPNKMLLRAIKSSIPVKYLILHLESFSEADRENILFNAAQLSDGLKLVKVFGSRDYVFKIIYED